MPPKSGPNKLPDTCPICSVPSVLPAELFGVCAEIIARDVGMNPVTRPIAIRRKNNWYTDVTKPIKKMLRAMPVPVAIRIFLYPRLSPNRPQNGDTKNAMRNVMPNT